MASCGDSSSGSGALTAPGSSAGRGAVGRRLARRAAAAARLALFEQAERLLDHAVGQRRDHVVLARGRAHSSRFLNSIHGSCLSPGLAMRTSSHRPASFSPCSLNTSLPSRHALVRIADRLPGAAVPDDHRAGAVLLAAGSCPRSCRTRPGGLRHAPPCACPSGRSSGPSAPPSSAARRRARAGSRSAGATPSASGSRTTAPRTCCPRTPFGSGVTVKLRLAL